MWLYVILSTYTDQVTAKDDKNEYQWNLSGQLSFNSQWYNIESTSGLEITPRQPGDLHRVMLTPTLSYGDFTLPVRIIFSSRQTNRISMQASHQSFNQFLRNPLNTFSIAPTYKWARAIIGSQIVGYSSFTTGDTRLFGSAIELTPGKWNFSAFYGTSQRVIQPDTLLNIPGAYKRNFTALKLGYGRESQFHLFLNMAMIDDDIASVSITSPTVRPQQGASVSISGGFPIGKYLLWKNEVALSFFTRDKNAEPFQGSNYLSPFSLLYNTNISSRNDYAWQSSLEYNRGMFDLGVRVTHVGDGFTAPGFPYMQTDRMDFTINPRIRLWNNKLNLSGTAGYRKNNLSKTKLRTSSQLLLALNVNTRISQTIGINSSFSNFGMETDFLNDTLRLRVISTAFSMSPWINISVGKGSHQISSTISLNRSEDTNLMTYQQVSRQTFSLFVNHAFAFSPGPMNTDFSISYLSNNAQWGITNFTIQPGVSYRFFNRRLQTSLRVAYINSKLSGFSADNAFMFRPGLRGNIGRQWTIRAESSLRIYRYGSSKPDTGFTENIIRTFISYRF